MQGAYHASLNRMKHPKHLVVKIGAVVGLTVLATSLAYQPALAAEEEVPEAEVSSDAPQDNLVVTAPAADAKVDTSFAITGTINPECTLYDQVFLVSEANKKSYVLTSAPQQSGGQFTFQIDTTQSGRIGKAGDQVVPEVPPSGPVIVFVFSSPNCQTTDADTSSVAVNLQHTAAPTARSQPRPLPTVPASLGDLIVEPDKAYDDEGNEIREDKKKNGPSKGIPTEVWLVLGLLGGIGAVALAEYSAYRYHKRKKR